MQVLRHFAAAISVVVGVCLAVFSVAVAFGWGHRTLSAAATAIALLGYAAVFTGYRLLRDSDWQVLASACLKVLLIVGSGLLIPGMTLIVMRFRGDDFFAAGYFIAVGCSSLIAYLAFQKITR